MAIPSKQIGWGTEENLLWQISKQLETLTSVTYNSGSNLSTTYVPYTGAISSVNLGANNISANAFFNGFNSITASGTQVVLTINSAPEILVSGSGGQTIKLPDATTLTNGTIFSFNNNQSSGAISVNNNSNTLVLSVPSGGYAEIMLLSNSIAAGSWDKHFQAPSNVSWSTNTFDYPGSITSATWNGNVIAINRGGTGSATQNFVDLTTNQSIAGVKTFNPSVTAASAIARGTYLNPTLVAAANSDVLVGLDINPTFTNGSFTSVQNVGLRVQGTGIAVTGITGGFNGGLIINSARGTAQSAQITVHSPSSGIQNNIYEASRPATPTAFAISHYVGTDVNVYWNTQNASYNYLVSGTQQLKLNTTGNLVIQSGGTFTDAGYKLDVTGTSRITTSLNIGGTTTDTSAILQTDSTTKGVLFPRMTTAQKNAIATPAAGLVVFDTTLGKLCVFSTTWQTITSM